jgi:hypothetical protein
MDRLHSLDVSINRIRSIKGLMPPVFSHLLALNLSENFLTSLDGVAQIPTLAALNVNYNCLENVDEAFKCPKLRSLQVVGNRLTNMAHLDVGETSVEGVGYLSIDGNDIGGFVIYVEEVTVTRPVSSDGTNTTMTTTATSHVIEEEEDTRVDPLAALKDSGGESGSSPRSEDNETANEDAYRYSIKGQPPAGVVSADEAVPALQAASPLLPPAAGSPAAPGDDIMAAIGGMGASDPPLAPLQLGASSSFQVPSMLLSQVTQ